MYKQEMHKEFLKVCIKNFEHQLELEWGIYYRHSDALTWSFEKRKEFTDDYLIAKSLKALEKIDVLNQKIQELKEQL